MTDFRALVARMADELDYYRQLLMDDRRETHALAVEARAALAEPQPAADGEVAELVAEIRHFLAGYGQMRGLDPENIYSIHRGHAMEAHITVSRLTRAADLLERLSATGKPGLQVEPIPESERLRQMEDLAADAMAGLRYIEHWHGRLSGVGWDRLHGKAMRLDPLTHLPLPKEVE